MPASLPNSIYYAPRPDLQVLPKRRNKLKKPNPNVSPQSSLNPQPQTPASPDAMTMPQGSAQLDKSMRPVNTRERGIAFKEPEERREPLHSRPPRSPSPYPTAQNVPEDVVELPENAMQRSPRQFPHDVNPDMYAGVCWCCGSILERRGLGEECVECWADQIVY